MTTTSDSVTYGSYLRLPELLSCQSPATAQHDELLFVIIHQVYELWFKETLHELDYLQKLLAAGDLPRAGHTMKRVLTILAQEAPPRPRPQFGSARGLITISDDFEEPLKELREYMA